MPPRAGFGWSSWKTGRWYEIVKDNLPKIKELGADLIWLPPPSESVSPQGYMPGQLYDLDSEWGKKEKLVELLKVRDSIHACLESNIFMI